MELSREESVVSNAQRKGNRKSSATYTQRDNRTKNKARRIAKDAKRAKPMDCGHGSRYRSKYDGDCKRCHGEAIKRVMS